VLALLTYCVQIQCRDKHWQAIRTIHAEIADIQGKVGEAGRSDAEWLFINVRHKGLLGTTAALKHGSSDYSRCREPSAFKLRGRIGWVQCN
jgi:hypothetical protein